VRSRLARFRVARRRQNPLVARQCWIVGGIAAAVVMAALLAVGPDGHHGFYSQGDAPFFFAVSRNPFSRGVPFPGTPAVQGVAYRYGRVGFPLVGWLLALGRPFAAKWSLAVVYVGAFGAWVAIAGEHLRRSGRSPRLALWIFATPWALLCLIFPEIVSEPMAAALVLLAFLYEREGRHKAARVSAAMAILTREVMIVAFVPLAWRAWKERRWAAVRDWALVLVPYAAWSVWLRFRVGGFPFLDPASSRRGAFSAPLAGWLRTLNGPLDNRQAWGVLIAALTVGAILFVAMRGPWIYPVFAFPGEALRILAPTQMLLLIAACGRGSRLEPLEEVDPRRGDRDDGQIAGRNSEPLIDGARGERVRA
jgi:hypothetical protein